MKRFIYYALPLALLAVAAPHRVSAQDTSADDIEALFSAEEEAASRPAPETKVDNSGSAGRPDETLPDAKDLSDLAKLAPFSDVAVIQKRYLPKTGRFELYGGLSGVLNDAFFLGLGGGARAGYYFKERWGIELMGLILNASEKQVTTDLRSNRGVTTQSLVTAESYYGVDLKWTPVYGKMTLHNKRITPFDLYFSVGGGLTGTNQGDSAPTVHLGTGQIFALSKGMAFRWDFSWNFFYATSKIATRQESALYNNLFLTVGASFFFPEATYR